MDDIAEQQQLAGEISTAISNPVGFDQDVDEVNTIKFLFSRQRALVKFFSQTLGRTFERVRRITRS